MPHDVEKLERLRDLLIADAANRRGMRFDITQLGRVEERGTIRATLFGPSVAGLNCDTYGCAMGLAAFSGAFPELGGSSTRLGTS